MSRFWPTSSSLIAADPRRDNIPYRDATREITRVDMHSMTPEWKNDAVEFARQLSLQGGGPFSRKHSIQERLNSYVNKRSRCGKYIEVLPEEVPELLQPSLLLQSSDLLPVEIGLNRQKHACKVAFTVPLKTGRIAFLCIGIADGGLKTFYVNPKFKWRATYQCTDSRVLEPRAHATVTPSARPRLRRFSRPEKYSSAEKLSWRRAPRGRAPLPYSESRASEVLRRPHNR